MNKDEFADMINIINPLVVIMGLTFSPADILKTLDPVAFNVMYNDYINYLETE